MLRPLRDGVVVEPIERVKSDIIAVVAEEKPNLGRVVAVGPGKRVKGRIIPVDAKPGDTVRFGTDEGYLTYTEFRENGKTYLLMSEQDICFISEAEPVAA